MKSIPLVCKVALAPAIRYLSQQGVPVDRYLRRVGLTPLTPETYESLIPLHQVRVFLKAVAHTQCQHDLGFHIAGDHGIESLGTYGRLIAGAFTFHEAFQITRELISSYNSGLKVWLEQSGEQVRYCQQFVGDKPCQETKEIVHLGLANTLALMGVHRGSEFRPVRIELASPPINLGRLFPELGDLPVRFDQPQTSLWFDRSWLSRPLPTLLASNDYTYNDTERASLLETSPSPSLVGQLEQIIESVLGQRTINLNFTASIIGTSPRTLQRRLAESNLTFSRLVESVRFRTAQRLLSDWDVPLTEIANRLSYSDSANFIRAFKRWAGVGPTEFRDLHCDCP